MMAQEARKMRAYALASVVAPMLAGCAASTPEPIAIQPFANAERPLEGYSHTIVTSEAVRGVEISEQEQQRVVAIVKHEMRSRAPGRFEFVKEGAQMIEAVPISQEPGLKKPKTALMHILFTEYEKRSRFGGYMHAGEFRINTDVTLRDESTNELLGRYQVLKKFVRDKIFSLAIDMEDIEEAVARGIADILAPDTPEAE